KPAMRESALVSSSVIPLARYASAESLLRLTRGSTAIERASAVAAATGGSCAPDFRSPLDCASTIPIATSAAAARTPPPHLTAPAVRVGCVMGSVGADA